MTRALCWYQRTAMNATATEPERRATEGSTGMATTSSNLVAGKALAAGKAAAGPGGDGTGGSSGRGGRRAKLAAGVAILGCAAALAFGGLRAGGDLSSSAA